MLIFVEPTVNVHSLERALSPDFVLKPTPHGNYKLVARSTDAPAKNVCGRCARVYSGGVCPDCISGD